jgi:hypothetical protein
VALTRRLLVGALLGAASARADSPDKARFLDWNAPSDCATRDQVAARISDLAGVSPGGASVTAKVVVTSTGDGFHASIFVRRAGFESTRTLSAPSCADLADAIVVMIVLVIDPSATDPGRADASRRDPSIPDSSADDIAESDPLARPIGGSSSPTSEKRSSPATPASHPTVLGVGAAGVFETGALPHAAYGASAFVSASWPHLRADLGAYLLASQSVPSEAGSKAVFGLSAATAAACVNPRGQTWTPGWCAGFEFGEMSGRASGGLVQPVDARKLWAALSTGPSIAWRVHPHWALVGRADLVFPLTRTTFYIDPIPEVHRPGYLAGRLSMGTEIRF